MVCLLIMDNQAIALGQTLSIGGSSSSGNGLPPRGVNRYGALESAWVKSPITDQKLFQIASPTVIDRSSTERETLPVEVRGFSIEALIQLEIARFRNHAMARLSPFSELDPSAPSPSAQVIVSRLKNLPVVQVANRDSSRPMTIATVTEFDSNFYSEEAEQVAQQWKTALEAEISQAQSLYSAPVLNARIRQSLSILLGIFLATAVLASLNWKLSQKQSKLSDRRDQLTAIPPAQQALEAQQALHGNTAASSVQNDSPEPESPLFPEQTETEQAKTQQVLRAERNLEKRINAYRFLRWVSIWGIVLVWYLGLYYLTTRLPILMHWSDDVLIQPLSLIAIWFVISLLLRFSNSAIERSVNAWKDNSYLTFGNARRKALRSRTTADALKGLVFCLLSGFGILATLAKFGLPVPSILAGSALVGLALSFGAQSLIQDLVNGCLILLEDQFAVGDIITANGESGLVEKLNLRLTQLRNGNGELITIPNSRITLVKNQTSSWSRVNLGIEVAYDTDLDAAIALIDQIAVELSEDQDWKSYILERPQVLGVDDFGSNSVTIRIWIQTEPLQQFSVAREFRRRLKPAFDQANISIPFPQRSIWFENSPNSKPAQPVETWQPVET